MKELQPVVLCGGAGTRLWPLSREQYPKQLLALGGERTLLQETLRRASLVADAAPVLVCNEELRFLVARQAGEFAAQSPAIVLEPNGRGTAPALTLAALHVLCDGDPVLLVTPADHEIADEDAFRAAIERGAALARDGTFVTFGVPPSGIETGYGYIRAGASVSAGSAPAACRVEAFVEKPDAELARRYVASGCHLWNSGMLAVRASAWIDAVGRFRPKMLSTCERAHLQGARDGAFYRVDRGAYADCPQDSIDYAILERTGREEGAPPAAVVWLDAGWSDVGAWDALWERGRKDANGNVTHGDALAVDTRNSLLVSKGRLLACAGLEDVVVVETPDAVMVARRGATQIVKHVVAALRGGGRAECVTHRKVERPWGSYDGIDGGERFQVKRLVVNPGAMLSLQLHYHRAEHWVVVRGTARVTRGEETFLLAENQSTYIPLGVRHRLENPGKVPLEIIEIQSGAYLGEDDIVRFDDRYGRAAVPLRAATAGHAGRLPAAGGGTAKPGAA